MTPAGTSNELDVQNKWEENTKHKHRVTAGGVRYRTAINSGSGKYIGYGLRIETGTERTAIIVDIFNTI